MAGVPGAPSKLIVSGRYPYHERFDLYNGGAYVSIEPDAGDDITGISTYDNPNSGGTQTIIVFKENSVWEVTVGAIIAGDVALTDLQYRLLSRSQGCSSHRSIVAVENDIMFANSRGIYILRHEPQLLNVINASEMSAKIRPFFEGLTHADLNSSAGFYADKKYVLSFPISKKTIVFDRERLSFMGPWTTTFGINGWARFVDANGIERWVCTDSGDNYISEFRKSYTDDKGSAFTTLFRTKKEDFKDPFIFKTITEIYTLFRNVVGSVQANIYLEERSGATLTATSFSITSSTGVSGIGTDLWGLAKFGWSNTNPQSRSEESPKKTTIYKTARTVQIEVKTTGNSDNYELLSILISGILQNRGNSPQSWTT